MVLVLLHDNVATSQKPIIVLDCLRNYYEG
jgi:hypothetical protein